jgi:hypothetical protein
MVSVPLFGTTNLLALQGIDNYGNKVGNAVDTIMVTNTGNSAPRPVVINEWMSDNAAPDGLADPLDGLFQDWFELFNPNTNAVNLSGFYVTDNLSQPTKWRIPTNTFIASHGFLLVWADNQPEQNSPGTNGHLHASFQLNNSGEAIGLFAPDATPHSSVIFGGQFQNISQGLFPDGNTNAVYFMTNFTPRFENSLAGALRFTQISVSEGMVTLRWASLSGRFYQVQFKTNFSDGVWNPLGPGIRATDESTIISDLIGANNQRVYRVVRIE